MTEEALKQIIPEGALFEIQEFRGEYQMSHAGKCCYRVRMKDGHQIKEVIGGLYQSLLNGYWHIRQVNVNI